MDILCQLLNLYVLAIFARIVLSWFPVSSGGFAATVGGFLTMITEPLLGPIRRVMPTVRIGGMGLDLSPIIAVLGLQIVVGQIILGC